MGRGTVLAEGLLIQYRVQSRAGNIHGPSLASELGLFHDRSVLYDAAVPSCKQMCPMRPSAAICL